MGNTHPFTTHHIDALIMQATQRLEWASNYLEPYIKNLNYLKEQIQNGIKLSQDAMYTLVYQLYQILDDINDVCDVMYDCRIVVQTGRILNHPWRKLTPADIANIIDWQPINDAALQSAVRSYFNRKRRLDIDWNAGAMSVEKERVYLERYFVPLMQIAQE